MGVVLVIGGYGTMKQYHRDNPLSLMEELPGLASYAVIRMHDTGSSIRQGFF